MNKIISGVQFRRAQIDRTGSDIRALWEIWEAVEAEAKLAAQQPRPPRIKRYGIPRDLLAIANPYRKTALAQLGSIEKYLWTQKEWGVDVKMRSITAVKRLHHDIKHQTATLEEIQAWAKIAESKKP